MSGYFDKWIKEEITVDGSQTERAIKRNFHAGIRFEAYEYLSDEADLFSYFGGIKKELPPLFWHIKTSLHTTAAGKNALRLQEDIPAFDSGDRMYGSWFALYLMPGKKPGTVDGICCVGGYRLATAVYCRNLRRAPQRLRLMLQLIGVG